MDLERLEALAQKITKTEGVLSKGNVEDRFKVLADDFNFELIKSSLKYKEEAFAEAEFVNAFFDMTIRVNIDSKSRDRGKADIKVRVANTARTYIAGIFK